MAYPSRLFIGLGLGLANGWPNAGGAIGWYSKITGVIVCGAIIPCNEVIECL